MASLPEIIRPYFDALANGFEALLPASRVENKRFLLNLHQALEQELRLTAPDLTHLRTIMKIADQSAFPPIVDVQSCGEAEAFLIKVCPQYPKKQIRLALAWALFLLARHGLAHVDLPNVAHWLRIWRRVQAFHTVEQGLLSDFIRWLSSKLFAPRTTADIMREVYRFRQWMQRQGFSSFGQIGNLELQRYLLDRACGQTNASKQRILGHLKPILYYYKDVIDGGYAVPDHTINAPRLLGVNESANSEEIACLWQALEERTFPAMSGLMLLLVIGHGLPLKALPLLRLTGTPGELVYTERLPCRRGEQERMIRLDLGTSWVAYYWQSWLQEREKETAYLFTSGHGIRRKRPVSVDYCQSAVQAVTQAALGYPVPVNYLERGALKRLARGYSLSDFMSLTDCLSKSRLSRMMTWLALRCS